MKTDLLRKVMLVLLVNSFAFHSLKTIYALPIYMRPQRCRCDREMRSQDTRAERFRKAIVSSWKFNDLSSKIHELSSKLDDELSKTNDIWSEFDLDIYDDLRSLLAMKKKKPTVPLSFLTNELREENDKDGFMSSGDRFDNKNLPMKFVGKDLPMKFVGKDLPMKFVGKDLPMKFFRKKRAIPLPVAGTYNHEENDEERFTSSDDSFANKDLPMKSFGKKKKRVIPMPLAGTYNHKENDERKNVSYNDDLTIKDLSMEFI